VPGATGRSVHLKRSPRDWKEDPDHLGHCFHLLNGMGHRQLPMHTQRGHRTPSNLWGKKKKKGGGEGAGGWVHEHWYQWLSTWRGTKHEGGNTRTVVLVEEFVLDNGWVVSPAIHHSLEILHEWIASVPTGPPIFLYHILHDVNTGSVSVGIPEVRVDLLVQPDGVKSKVKHSLHITR